MTVISHSRESRTHVAIIPRCNWDNRGCYSKDVTYTGVNVAQLRALTRVSQNCEQFIKFECNNDVAFVPESAAWWVSRDGRKMNYWGGAGGAANTCTCGVANSCLDGQKCNCYNGGSGWREDSETLMAQVRKYIIHYGSSSVMARHEISVNIFFFFAPKPNGNACYICTQAKCLDT